MDSVGREELVLEEEKRHLMKSWQIDPSFQCEGAHVSEYYKLYMMPCFNVMFPLQILDGKVSPKVWCKYHLHEWLIFNMKVSLIHATYDGMVQLVLDNYITIY